MKTVHTPAMVAHLWANQSQEEARNSGGTLFFKGRTIYSYGEHFPIASILTTGLLLWNDRSYSNTTSKHQYHVRRAINDAEWTQAIFIELESGNSFFYQDFRDLEMLAGLAKEQADYYLDKVASKTRASRERDGYIVKYNQRMTALDRLTGVENPRVTFDNIEPKKFSAEANEMKAAAVQKLLENCIANALEMPTKTIKEKLAFMRTVANNPRMTAASQKLRTKRGLVYRALVNRWYKGESIEMPVSDSHLVRISGNEFETSGGARVPLSVAPMIWRAVKTCRETKTEYVPDQRPQVGQFSLNKIDSTGRAVIGCHSIAFNEFARLAKELGYV